MRPNAKPRSAVALVISARWGTTVHARESVAQIRLAMPTIAVTTQFNMLPTRRPTLYAGDVVFAPDKGLGFAKGPERSRTFLRLKTGFE